MITVEDVLKSVAAVAETDKDFLPLQHQLERFSPGTPIKGVAADAGLSSLSFTHETTARMDNGEVVLE